MTAGIHLKNYETTVDAYIAARRISHTYSVAVIIYNDHDNGYAMMYDGYAFNLINNDF